MDTVSTLLGVFASWAPVLTEPTFANLAVLLRGAVLASGPRGGMHRDAVRSSRRRVEVSPGHKRGDEAFFTTDPTMAPEAIVEAFVRRWSLETAFEETRAHLGMEPLRNRSANAVRRSVPLLLALYSLIVAWFARHVGDPGAWVRSRPWYPKKHVTFSDMLAAARHDILTEPISSRLVAGMAASEIGAPALSEPNPSDFAPRLTA